MRIKNRIEKSIELQFPISQIWQAITDYNEFGKWFKVKINAPFMRNKTSYGYINYPGYEHLIWQVVVQEMEPEQLFSFTWHPYAVDPKKDYSQEIPTLVEFRLQNTPTGTLLKISESGFDSLPHERKQKAFEMNNDGWELQISNIKEYLIDKCK